MNKKQTSDHQELHEVGRKKAEETWLYQGVARGTLPAP